MSLSEANSFLLLQPLRRRKRAKGKKERKRVENLSAPGARGHGWEFAHGAAGLAAEDVGAAGETPPSWRCLLHGSGLFSRAGHSTSLVPSPSGLCHPLLWELESTPNPDACCTCDNILTKEKRNRKRLSKLNCLQQLL